MAASLCFSLRLKNCAKIVFLVHAFAVPAFSQNVPKRVPFEEQEQSIATDVKITVYGQPMTNSIPTVKVGVRSLIDIRFRMPGDVRRLSFAHLKGISFRPDGSEVIMTSVGSRPKIPNDGTYQLEFDVQSFRKPMELDVRIQSAFSSVPYVVSHFPMRVEP